MKKRLILGVILISLICVPFVSAGWLDWWDKITGRAIVECDNGKRIDWGVCWQDCGASAGCSGRSGGSEFRCNGELLYDNNGDDLCVCGSDCIASVKNDEDVPEVPPEEPEIPPSYDNETNETAEPEQPSPPEDICEGGALNNICRTECGASSGCEGRSHFSTYRCNADEYYDSYGDFLCNCGDDCIAEFTEPIGPINTTPVPTPSEDNGTNETSEPEPIPTLSDTCENGVVNGICKTECGASLGCNGRTLDSRYRCNEDKLFSSYGDNLCICPTGCISVFDDSSNQDIIPTEPDPVILDNETGNVNETNNTQSTLPTNITPPVPPADTCVYGALNGICKLECGASGGCDGRGPNSEYRCDENGDFDSNGNFMCVCSGECIPSVNQLENEEENLEQGFFDKVIDTVFNFFQKLF
ncbi:MAG: hypothetical protein U9O94_00590 [Nanoarchaeota archaeon]|nr:hypothetical protein [Nanoarchaeota archaeon]